MREAQSMRALGQMKVEVTPAGIPILVDNLPWSRSAAVAINMAVGSRDEPSDQHGIAHMLEHVLFKGTGHHTSRQMSQEVEAAGGEMNGYTTKEMTAYYVSTLDETIGTAEELLAEIVREPLLDVKDIETEKKVVTQEIKMSEDDPDTYSHELLMKKVWKGNPMADPEAGYVECVEALDREKVSGFFEGFYRPPNMVVVASGNVDAKQVLKWATESFDGLPIARMPKKRESPAFKPGIQLFPREGDQAYVAMAFPAVDARHKDRYAHGLVGGVLAAGTSSRLYQKVREENGLVYSIYSMTYAFTDVGMTGIFFSTSTREHVQGHGNDRRGAREPEERWAGEGRARSREALDQRNDRQEARVIGREPHVLPRSRATSSSEGRSPGTRSWARSRRSRRTTC